MKSQSDLRQKFVNMLNNGQIDGQFLFDYYFNNGFTLLSFEEVMALDKVQKNEPEQPKKTIIDNLKTMSSKMVQSVSSCDGYYDEFPDAYGQYL